MCEILNLDLREQEGGGRIDICGLVDFDLDLWSHPLVPEIAMVRPPGDKVAFLLLE